MMDAEGPSSHMLAAAEGLLHSRQLTESLQAFDQAEAEGADPDRCSAGRWMLAMLRGDFVAAWQESDAILARGTHDPHRLWQGENLAGKRVVLRCLHGFGDTIQFLRYMPMLCRRAASVVLEVPPKLLELAPMFAGVDEVITWGAGAPQTPPGWDVQIEVNELPYIFRTHADDLPIATQYLKLSPAALSRVDVSPAYPSSLKVGLVWASGDWNPSRSVPQPCMQTLVNTPHCEFWNLQGGTSRPQWSLFHPGGHLHEAAECKDKVVNLAALIAQLDLVITADTMAAHLAGAQGAPCWVLLEAAADWRWQHGRVDSPWYPSLRLFRQQQRDDWSGVVAEVAHQLRAVASRGAHHCTED